MNNQKYTNFQLIALVLLRVVIGWHFMYEGIAKLLNPNWSSLGYLMDSGGMFSGMFQNWATYPGLLNVMDFLNIWGLIFIGAGLIMGLFTRIASYAGMILLAFYYLSHPPLIGANYAIPSEGNYLLVNKNLIELLVLWVLTLFPSSKIIGIDRLLFKK